MSENIVPISTGNRRRRIELHRLDRLPVRPHREDVVAGLMAAGELVAMVGRPGVGKTALLARLAVDIAEGRSFLGRRVTQGAVVYVAAEKGEELKRRFLAIRRKAAAPVYITLSRPNLSSPADVQDLIEQIERVCEIERRCPTLVVFDTLARLMPGLNEDKASDASRIVEALTQIAEGVPTAAILVAHHVTKSNGTIRGSSALLGGLDLVLRVERNKGPLGKIVVEKANSIDEGQVLGFRLTPVEYREEPGLEPEAVISAEQAKFSGDEPSVPRTAKLTSKTKALLSLIEKHAPVNRLSLLSLAREHRILEGTTNGTRMACSRYLGDLETLGLITIDDETITVTGKSTSAA